jgi:hypothetical protein
MKSGQNLEKVSKELDRFGGGDSLVTKFTNGGNTEVENSVFLVYTLTKTVHPLAGDPHGINVAESLSGPIRRFLKFDHQFGRHGNFGDRIHVCIFREFSGPIYPWFRTVYGNPFDSIPQTAAGR